MLTSCLTCSLSLSCLSVRALYQDRSLTPGSKLPNQVCHRHSDSIMAEDDALEGRREVSKIKFD